MTDRIDRTERLLNLVICLLGASVPVTRAAVRAQIPGYADSASDVAFERMFERDKDELRSMGIPVETVLDSGGEVLGYRVPREAYALQPIDFTVEERAAIAVAAQAWSGAPIATVPGTAVRKLESATGDWTPAVVGAAVEMTSADAALLPLMRALREGRVVRFAYRPPDRASSQERTVSPWGLTSAAGRWFLLGYDHDRAAQRTFRLSRMSGPVQITAERRQEPPTDFDPARARIAAQGDSGLLVRFRVAAGRAASLRRRAVTQPGEDPFTAEEVTVDVGSVDEAVALACAGGADVIVLSPAEVVTATAEALSRIAAEHGGAA